MEETKKIILLIEDDADMRETTGEFLTKEGFAVALAENGSVGIQLAIQKRPDIILCDIAMPGVTGYEVFNILRQINTTSVIPFIFLSAKASKEDILLGMHLGVDDYITKPFQFDYLLRVINMRIENRKKVLELNDEKFNVLLNNTFSGAFILKGQNIEYANPQFARMLGYPQEEITGDNLINLICNEDVRNTADLVAQCNDGAIRNFETRFRAIHKNNNLVPLSIKGSSIDYKGERRLIITVIEEDGKEKTVDQNHSPDDVKLSGREIEILKLFCQGMSNAEIAGKLFLSERTVEGHRARIYDKTGTKNAVTLALWAVKRKLIDL